ncbi:hypothetical protein KCIQHHLO_42 [Staphylococcus phage HMGUsa1]|uniref:Uncharacterized protein n=1 Tax=Staphylococcus aureus (strain COL) TaxID=93062 RepID=A0A0H2WY95_STAAC|nr:hypothetical protein [Staphylococcus aureus]WID30737.1 hypothetical protein KCIQHHLO_42 [Staphylococcus phage HMGUsa1]AAW37539.1 conserved hypothetical protein [Staphylococcus aureus subsp. aureus COL]AHW66196.1 hypothetical protein X998_0319 [Staphylococcus aureus]MBR1370957.1 hypothetical protein [Staphylococcus aureus]MCS1399777.1 hypothetical protein [Staphylococcus aureus]
MKNYYHLLSFDDDLANDAANDLLKEGWDIVHVGTKLVKILDNGQAYYNTEYVLGGTKNQYEKYLEDCQQSELDYFQLMFFCGY